MIEKKVRNNKLKKPAIHYVMVAVYSLIVATIFFAIYILIITALKTAKEYALGNTWKLPNNGYHFENFLNVFKVLTVNKTGYVGMIWNTIWITIAPAILNIAGTTLLSYAYAKYNFFGRRALWMLNVVTMTVALPGVAVSYYKLFSDLGLRNSPLFLISCWGGFGANFLMLVSFWNSVSNSYAEAAVMDGAGHMSVFLKVMFPQTLPLVGVFFLLQFVAGWEGMGPCLYYLPNYPNMAYGLYVYSTKTERTINYPIYYSALIMLAIPSIIMYAVFQDRIMRGMNIGGLKG